MKYLYLIIILNCLLIMGCQDKAKTNSDDQSVSEKETNDIQVILKSDKREYKIDEPIMITVIASNKGKQPINIGRWVLKSTGKELPWHYVHGNKLFIQEPSSGVIKEWSAMKDLDPKLYEWPLLKPKERTSYTFNLSEILEVQGFNIRKSGQYKITQHLRMGAVSNVLTIRISPYPLNGKHNSFYDNGQKKEECEFKNGEHVGKYIFWQDNGKKFIEGNYKDGREDGLWVFYYDNGQKQSERIYKNGLLSGKWVSWYRNGNKKAEGNLKKGRHGTAFAELIGMVGKWSYWHPNGQKSAEGEYINDGRLGLKTSKWLYWDDEGRIAREEQYNDKGTLIKSIKY